MTVLYVTEPGATVRISGESLVVTADEHPVDGCGASRRRILIEVEPHRLEQVALVGVAHITAAAMSRCLREGIGVSWLARSGEFLGRVVPALPRSADLRLCQYRTAERQDLRLTWARDVVGSKLGNARTVLRDIQSNEPGRPDLAAAIEDLGKLEDAVRECELLSGLLGLEGTGARIYFEAMRDCFKGGLTFPGRRHRPPPDPINALLSFGYVLLSNRIAGALEARGLDPCIGFFHELRPGRPSLAVDLLEELRHPIVDRFVLRVCNLRIIREEMFDPPDPEDGVRLTRDGLKLFFKTWEEFLLKPLRERDNPDRVSGMDLVRRQVERFASALRHGGGYEPFRYGG